METTKEIGVGDGALLILGHPRLYQSVLGAVRAITLQPPDILSGSDIEKYYGTMHVFWLAMRRYSAVIDGLRDIDSVDGTSLAQFITANINKHSVEDMALHIVDIIVKNPKYSHAE